ncbi:hypothetical protein JMF89_07815 [Clostridiaceae bacterium UIB06]|uniref:Uncharacterized protein n=1 Tax=Clostridium thailandense TaxID=2794346 RepID=A0A949WPV4_9CLOT|nr:hypothetical protein [Clostridium thailandense]MBV7271881.1 hypothetical protein [Clostridium thailandense]MCH5137107.1 hypothetical protein [Clostridiaceae bacterium UIB06]
MEINEKNKQNVISALVEAAARPILEAKSYWYQSIYNVLRGKKQNTKTEDEYITLLKSDIISLKKLWNRELDVIYSWAENHTIPESDKINEAILKIENDSETEVCDGKIRFKNGEGLDKNVLEFIERYNAIQDEDGRIRALHEDYIYLKIRDYITLNIYQFLSENKQISEGLFKDDPKDTVQRIGDLTSNYADMCMYDDVDDE